MTRRSRSNRARSGMVCHLTGPRRAHPEPDIAVSQQAIEWFQALFRIALAVAGAVFTVALAQATLAE